MTVMVCVEVVPMAFTPRDAPAEPTEVDEVPGEAMIQEPESNLVTPLAAVPLVTMPARVLAAVLAPPRTRFLAPVLLTTAFAPLAVLPTVSAPVPFAVMMLLVEFIQTLRLSVWAEAPVKFRVPLLR